MACEAVYKIKTAKIKPIREGYFFKCKKLPMGFALFISKARLFSFGSDSGRIK